MKKLFNILRFQKEKFIAVICLIYAIIAVISIVFIVQSKNGNDKQNEAESYIWETIPQQTYSPDSPQSLKFRSVSENGCMVAGIGQFEGEELIIPEESPSGQVVIGIDAKAFADCTELVSIEIPESIVSIGDQAFRGCSSLVSIEVERSNTRFCSVGGILFSKDKTRLICCPAARIGSSYLVSTNIKSISDYAFYGVKNINKLYYEGSTAQFESIKIGRGNEDFSSLPITCNYTNGK